MDLLDETEIKTEETTYEDSEYQNLIENSQLQIESVENSFKHQFTYTLDLSLSTPPADEPSNLSASVDKSTFKYVKLCDNTIETNSETPWTLTKGVLPRALERILSGTGLQVSNSFLQNEHKLADVHNKENNFGNMSVSSNDISYSNFQQREGMLHSTINPMANKDIKKQYYLSDEVSKNKEEANDMDINKVKPKEAKRTEQVEEQNDNHFQIDNEKQKKIKNKKLKKSDKIKDADWKKQISNLLSTKFEALSDNSVLDAKKHKNGRKIKSVATEDTNERDNLIMASESNVKYIDAEKERIILGNEKSKLHSRNDEIDSIALKISTSSSMEDNSNDLSDGAKKKNHKNQHCALQREKCTRDESAIEILDRPNNLVKKQKKRSITKFESLNSEKSSLSEEKEILVDSSKHIKKKNKKQTLNELSIENKAIVPEKSDDESNSNNLESKEISFITEESSSQLNRKRKKKTQEVTSNIGDHMFDEYEVKKRKHKKQLSTSSEIDVKTKSDIIDTNSPKKKKRELSKLKEIEVENDVVKIETDNEVNPRNIVIENNSQEKMKQKKRKKDVTREKQISDLSSTKFDTLLDNSVHDAKKHKNGRKVKSGSTEDTNEREILIMTSKPNAQHLDAETKKTRLENETSKLYLRHNAIHSIALKISTSSSMEDSSNDFSDGVEKKNHKNQHSVLQKGKCTDEKSAIEISDHPNNLVEKQKKKKKTNTKCESLNSGKSDLFVEEELLADSNKHIKKKNKKQTLEELPIENKEFIPEQCASNSNNSQSKEISFVAPEDSFSQFHRKRKKKKTQEITSDIRGDEDKVEKMKHKKQEQLSSSSDIDVKTKSDIIDVNSPKKKKRKLARLKEMEVEDDLVKIETDNEIIQEKIAECEVSDVSDIQNRCEKIKPKKRKKDVIVTSPESSKIDIDKDVDIFTGIFEVKESSSSRNSECSIADETTVRNNSTDNQKFDVARDSNGTDHSIKKNKKKKSTSTDALSDLNGENICSNNNSGFETDLNTSFSFADILSQSHTEKLMKKFNEIVVGSTSQANLNKPENENSNQECSKSGTGDQLNVPTKFSSTYQRNSLKEKKDRPRHERNFSKANRCSLDPSEEKKTKEKVIKLLQESKSMDEIEEELDISMTDVERARLENLDIVVPWEPSLIHRIAHYTSNPPSGSQRQELKAANIEVKLGKYTKEEDQQIKDNWREFCKNHDWDEEDYKPFLTGSIQSKHGILTKRQLRKFIQFISHGFQDRLMPNIYVRFQRLFSHNEWSTGRFTSQDDAIILEYVESERSVQPFAELSKILRRNRLAILKRYKLLQMRKSFSGESVRWDQSMTEQLLANIIEVTRSINLSELKDRHISIQEWHEISLRMNINTEKLKRAWLLDFYPRFFTPNYLERTSEIKMKLVDLLYEKYNDWREVDWHEVAKEFDKIFTHSKLCKMAKDLVRTRVPPKKRDNLHSALKYLRKHFEEVRKPYDKLKFVKDILRDTKNGRIIPIIRNQQIEKDISDIYGDIVSIKESDDLFSDHY